MTDIVERLRAYTSDDHERGCKGREYDCSCGYDDKRDPLLEEAAARIERLEAALRRWEQYGCPDCGGDCASANPPVSCCIMQETRAALGEKP